MCTVTFLPLSDTGFILTSNRDEQHSRQPALPPQWHLAGGVPVVFPKDAQAGGTWIATSGSVTVCLLNGALEAHRPKPPYRRSRGLMVLDFFGYESEKAFIEHYDFTGIEPFTMLIVNHHGTLSLTELRHTEAGELCIDSRNAGQPHIWSSATLYEPPVCRERERWFAAWLADQKNNRLDGILDFHRFGGTGSEGNDLIMCRDTVSTVSIASVLHHQDDGTEFWYQDLKSHCMNSLKIEPANA